jgi:cell shape-determining protein MreC
MGFFAFVLLIVVILAVIGLGWSSFSSGIITGFEKVIDIGTPILKNLTQEATEHVNSPVQQRNT